MLLIQIIQLVLLILSTYKAIKANNNTQVTTNIFKLTILIIKILSNM